MELIAAEERKDVFEEWQKDIREMVLYGLEQAKQDIRKILTKFAINWRRNIGMHKYKISISKPAKDDLESIGDHIAFKLLNPSAAENMVAGIQGLHSFCKLCIQFGTAYAADSCGFSRR